MEFPIAQVINQDKYPDKLQTFFHHFEGGALKITRFPAITDASGELGRAKSHMAVTRLAKEKGFPQVIIFEDNCIPSKDFESRLQAILPVLKKHTKDWDLFLGSPVEVEYPIVQVNSSPLLYRIHSARSSSCFLLNESAYDTVLNWSADDGPIDLQYARKLRLTCSYPHLTTQPSLSLQLIDSDATLLKSQQRMKQVQQALGVAVVAFFGVLQLSTQT